MPTARNLLPPCHLITKLGLEGVNLVTPEQPLFCDQCGQFFGKRFADPTEDFCGAKVVILCV